VGDEVEERPHRPIVQGGSSANRGFRPPRVLAARTVARMVELIGQIPEGSTAVADRNTFVRCVAVKEQHAEKVKHEVQVIWSDYFKPEHLAAFPDLHTKVWNLLKLAGKNKQGIDAQAAADLEAATKDFADMFWATKK
jgi:nickel superoxide dismutase